MQASHRVSAPTLTCTRGHFSWLGGWILLSEAASERIRRLR